MDIEEVRKEIYEKESEIDRLKESVAEALLDLNQLKENLRYLECEEKGLRPCLVAGTRLLFCDEDDIELEMIVIMDSRENYSLLLMTDYSNYFDYMGEYFVFSYKERYTDTLVEKICKEYDLRFVKVI